MAVKAAESMRKRMNEIYARFSPAKKVQRRLALDDDEEFDQAMDEEKTTLSQSDRAFLMECFTASAAENASQLAPIQEKVTQIESDQKSLSDRVATLEKGVPSADLSSVKTELMSELTKKFDELAIARSGLPPGLVTPGSQSSELSSAADPMETIWIIGSLGRNLEGEEVLSRARAALAKAGCDEPDDLFAPYAYGSQAFCKYYESQKAARTRLLLRRFPTKYDGENDSVWMDIKRTRQERLPKILLKDLERGIIEIKSANGHGWKVVRCGMTRRIFIDKVEAAKLDRNLNIVWSEACPIIASNRIELSERLSALSST